jgi:4-amino-4-deoxychorismate lyase
MSQFFESIRVKDGIAEQLGFHQLRVNKTLKAFDASNHSIELASIVQQLVLPADGLFKLKISYDLNGNYQSAFTPYQYKQIQNFALVDIKEQSYDYKFSNRDWINEALIQSGKDEIMMHDGGLIKDCS